MRALALAAVLLSSPSIACEVDMTDWHPPERAHPYLTTVYAAERAYGLPRNLLARVLHEESRYRDDIISGELDSSAGAEGIAQFMPATAAERGVDTKDGDPTDDIWGAADYLSDLYAAFGSWAEALGAYNWGRGNVRRHGLESAPKQTIDYITRICRDVDGL